MKTHSASALLWLSFFTLPAMADTIVLKDGTTLEGSVLREDATSYVVEVQVTKSIKDERVIAKADVETIKKERADAAAFEAIAKLVPTPDALPAGEYAQRIRAVEKFLKDHRLTPKGKQAQEMLATLQAEVKQIAAGGIKMNGRMIPAAEYRANAYEIDARIGAANISRLIKQSRFLEALRAFSAFDRDFENTAARDELLPEITSAMRSYLNGIKQSLSTFEARTKQRQIGLDRMPAADRRASEAAIAEENAMLEKRLASEEEQKIGWVSTHPFFEDSLEETVEFGNRELERLAKADSSPEVDGGKAYRDALSLIQSGGAQADVAGAITKAKAAGVSGRYIEILEAAAKSAGLTTP